MVKNDKYKAGYTYGDGLLEVGFNDLPYDIPSKGQPKPFLKITTVDSGYDMHEVVLTRGEARALVKYIQKRLEK